MSEPVLEAVDLVKHYPLKGGLLEPRRHVHALDGVSLDLAERETLAVVGESGCGKSTLARCLMRLEPVTSGGIRIRGREVARLAGQELRAIRRSVQIVFQDPYASLNPRRTIHQTIADPLRVHRLCPRRERRRRVEALLETVGLGPEFADRYPHELSGGQRQRVAIARALAVQPDVVICDEPVSALDVSIQAQVINLLKRLQRELGIAYLFISHDIALVQHISDRIAVMYLGQVVELAETRAIRARVLHPYTQALFSAVPVADPDAATAKRRILLEGDVPSPVEPPGGCRFHTRCPYREAICEREVPELRELGGRLVRCHLAGREGFPPPITRATAEPASAAP